MLTIIVIANDNLVIISIIVILVNVVVITINSTISIVIVIPQGIVPDDIIDDLRSKKLHPEPPPRGKVSASLPP